MLIVAKYSVVKESEMPSTPPPIKPRPESVSPQNIPSPPLDLLALEAIMLPSPPQSPPPLSLTAFMPDSPQLLPPEHVGAVIARFNGRNPPPPAASPPSAPSHSAVDSLQSRARQASKSKRSF